MLLLLSATHPADRRSVEFDELTLSYPPDRDPIGDPRLATRDTLTVDPRLHGRAVDADRLEVFDDQIGERALAQIRRIEAPQFANTHFSGVVDGDPGPVVEDTQTSGHTPDSPATTQYVTVLASGDSFDDGLRVQNRPTVACFTNRWPPDYRTGNPVSESTGSIYRCGGTYAAFTRTVV